MKRILLYIWQLPQNLVGLCIKAVLKDKQEHIMHSSDTGDIKYIQSDSFSGGISLGNYIIVRKTYIETIRHEYGHTVQSKYLGPLYLFIIGIPSIIWAGLYGNVIPYTKNGYYKFYTEKWADKLGGVER